jgi:hypothetical protein
MPLATSKPPISNAITPITVHSCAMIGLDTLSFFIFVASFATVA